MADTGQVTPMDGRMAELEALFLGGPLATKLQVANSFSIETLMDVLVVLFDECTTSSLRREKTVSEFIELGKLGIYNSVVFYKHSDATQSLNLQIINLNPIFV